ncbi:uncharacterized protein KY384_002938 [Bacidia gigantensis]|uniref:uncharacterized protein n=1 Tax=Bacidia gigantensis TaxID=2732470 RepID=UPI001D04452E|nr:uncharacterized protein KY384_002938 [Bacidia gigantensis]KAG8531310.1 hypothetical protein KY384_002938 [Bacidia gigantensis]
MRQAVRGIWWDEWFAVLALIATAGITTNILVGSQHGMGRHLPADFTLDEMVTLIKIVYAFIVNVTVAFGTLKISILFVYLRMTPHKSHKVVIYTLMGLVVAHNIPALLGQIFSCTPIHEYWNLGYPIFQNPHCINILVFDHFNNAWSALEDIIIWMLPVPTIYSLKVPIQRKSALYGLLAFSLISVLCAILRMTFVVLWVRSDDIAWDYILIPFLANMECCVALITTSAPGILPFLRSSTPAPPARPVPKVEVEKAPSSGYTSEKDLESQDSTMVPSTANQTDRSSKTWSLLSRLRPGTAMSKRASAFIDPNRRLTTCKSETEPSGRRTELKDFDDVEDVVPGVKTEAKLQMK